MGCAAKWHADLEGLQELHARAWLAPSSYRARTCEVGWHLSRSGKPRTDVSGFQGRRRHRIELLEFLTFQDVVLCAAILAEAAAVFRFDIRSSEALIDRSLYLRLQNSRLL